MCDEVKVYVMKEFVKFYVLFVFVVINLVQNDFENFFFGVDYNFVVGNLFFYFVIC